MQLYLIHCGFYDKEVLSGIYEFHIDIPIVARNLEEAKKKVRLEPLFIQKKMHIDGLQEFKTVGGYKLELIPHDLTSKSTHIENYLHRDF